MNRGLHVYCEKPVGECVFEAREVRKTYLENKNKLATQHGTQRHAFENFDRVAELIRDGAIGELQVVQAFGNRTHDKTGYLPAAGKAPKSVDWEQWIGPVQMHPYNPDYLIGKPGANCLQWNMYHDFGSWQVGDMGVIRWTWPGMRLMQDSRQAPVRVVIPTVLKFARQIIMPFLFFLPMTGVEISAWSGSREP